MTFYKGEIPNLSQETYIVPGIFDGIHIGHQELIKKAVSSARERGYAAVVLTFSPHPKTVVLKEPIQYIISLKEQKKYFCKLGVDILIRVNFEEIFNLSYEEYIKLLIDKLKMKGIWVGYDHKFGRNKEGNIDVLERLGKEKDFSVFILPDVYLDGEKVSSSRIKDFLLQGEIKRANFLLGRPYSVSGLVVESCGRGKKLGFPTANILWDETLFCPKRGVYLVGIKIDKKNFYGMANLGKRPTFNEEKTILEVHIFDFNRYLYNKEITIFFYQWIREEIRFANEEQLIIQLKKDKRHCKNLLKQL